MISYGTPNNFQQFYSSAFNPFTALYTAAAMPSASGTNPQVKTKKSKIFNSVHESK